MPDMNSGSVAQPGGYPPAAHYAGKSVVPNLVGLDAAAALVALTHADMIVGTVGSAWVSIANDLKITAQAVAAGSLALNGSAVGYTMGHKSVVPNLAGMTVVNATAALVAAGLVLGTNTPGAGLLGTVVGQSPAAAAAANAGSAVNITVGNTP